MGFHQYSGFDELSKELESYIQKVEKPLEILEVGAKEFVKDLKKLTKPISQIKKSGYTHLIDTFTYRVTSRDVEVGWGKWYGRILETGANVKGRNSNKRYHIQRKHLEPVYTQNKEKYFKLMINEFNK